LCCGIVLPASRINTMPSWRSAPILRVQSVKRPFASLTQSNRPLCPHKNASNSTHKNTSNSTPKNTSNSTHKNTSNSTHKNTSNSAHKNASNSAHLGTTGIWCHDAITVDCLMGTMAPQMQRCFTSHASIGVAQVEKGDKWLTKLIALCVPHGFLTKAAKRRRQDHSGRGGALSSSTGASAGTSAGATTSHSVQMPSAPKPGNVAPFRPPRSPVQPPETKAASSWQPSQWYAALMTARSDEDESAATGHLLPPQWSSLPSPSSAPASASALWDPEQLACLIAMGDVARQVHVHVHIPRATWHTPGMLRCFEFASVAPDGLRCSRTAVTCLGLALFPLVQLAERLNYSARA
jgi:hypothetical protein